MAKRRKQRRNPLAELSFGQEMELALSYNKEPVIERNHQNFDNALQKRAAYFAHRDFILNEGFASGRAGHRPGSWWAFEAKEPLKPQYEDLRRQIKSGAPEEWEQLFIMGEIDQVEGAQVLSDWLSSLNLHAGILSVYYSSYMQKQPMYHQSDSWPDQEEKHERQAKLLAEKVSGGRVAVDAWEKMKTKIFEDYSH